MVEPSGPVVRRPRVEKADWVCIAVLLVMTLCVFWQGFFHRADLIRMDAAYVFQCYYQFAADEVQAGRFPHWNPFSLCGTPYHSGLQGAVLYPFRWPLFWLSYPIGFALSLWAHFFLTGLFMYIFIRTTLRCGPVPALIGSLSLTFCGFMVGHVEHLTRWQAYPWIVLAVLLISQAIQRSSWTWAVGASLPVALVILTGDGNMPQLLGFGLALWAIGEPVSVLIRRIRGEAVTLKDALRPPAMIAVALLLGGAITTAQIYPALEQTKLSTRMNADWVYVTKLSAHPLQSIVLFAAPFYWGNDRMGHWGDERFADPCLYVGIVPLIFAAVAIVVCRRDRWVIRIVVLCVIAAALGAGKYLPFYWVLYEIVPTFDKIRGPCRLYLWVQFGVACLAAIGLQKTIVGFDAKGARRATLTAGAAALVVVVIIVGCLVALDHQAADPYPAMRHIEKLEQWSRHERGGRMIAAQTVPRLILYDGDLLTWLGIAAGVASGAACVGLVAMRKTSTSVGGALLAGLLMFDLGMFSTGTFSYSKDAVRMVLDRPGHVKFLQDNLGYQRYLCGQDRFGVTSLHRGMLFRIRHAIAGGIAIYHTPRQKKLLALLWKGNTRLSNLAGIRYLATDREAPRKIARPVFRDDQCFVYENKEVLPRAFLARQVRIFEDPNAILTEILSGRSDLSDVALLEQPIDPLPPIGPADHAPGEVLDLRCEPGKFEMLTDAPNARQLVITESHHPQWRCLIDGEPAPVYLTDWAFMSVRVPAGEHEVVLWFEPTYFKRGLPVTLASLTFVAGVLLVPWIRRRWRQRGNARPHAARSGTAG